MAQSRHGSRPLRCPLSGVKRTSVRTPKMTLMTHCVFRRSAFAERTLLARKGIGLLHLDVGRPDHLAPFFGFVSNELAEVDGRHGHWIATQVGEPLLDLGFGEPDVDLTV